MNEQRLKNIVIVGGGAGGLELVIQLARKFENNKSIKITLIDKSPIHLWKPLLHEAAAGTLNSYEDELSYYTLAAIYQFQFILGNMQGLDREKKEVYLSPMYDENNTTSIPLRSIQYDILVVAVGSISKDFKISGVKENCLFLDSAEQANYFHQYLIKSLMQLPYLPSKNLDIAIVGAGATGVELAAELHYAIHQMAEYGMQYDPKSVSFTLIEAAERVLPALSPHLSKLIQEQLQKLNINILIGEQVEKITEESILTRSGKRISAQIKVWAAGIKAPDFLNQIAGLETNKINQLVVRPTLQTTLDDAVFAMGDCASCIDEKLGKPVPPRAQASHQQAELLAKSMSLYLQNKPLLHYHYHDYGSLISLSYYETIGNLMGRITKSLMVEGKLARFAYLSLYRMHQKVIYGWWRTATLMFANLLTKKIRTRLKLH